MVRHFIPEFKPIGPLIGYLRILPFKSGKANLKKMEIYVEVLSFKTVRIHLPKFHRIYFTKKCGLSHISNFFFFLLILQNFLNKNSNQFLINKLRFYRLFMRSLILNNIRLCYLKLIPSQTTLKNSSTNVFLLSSDLLQGFA